VGQGENTERSGKENRQQNGSAFRLVGVTAAIAASDSAFAAALFT
jgi:hypothetical protein